MRKHLAIFKGSSGEKILQGRASVNIRSSKSKLPPFAVISSGDLVYIKPSGKDIIGQFRVKKVKFIEDPEAESRYTSEIFIGETQKFITAPVKPNKKDLRGWVVLD